MSDERIEVVAYSGYRDEECPRSFMIQGKKIEVAAILSMWNEERLGNKGRKRVFRIKGNDGYEYKIYYDEKMKQWFLAKE